MTEPRRPFLRHVLLSCAIAALASSLLGAVAATTADTIVGTWLTEDGDSRVEITATRAANSASVYSGKVVWLKAPGLAGKPIVDANNSDAALRGRPIMGLEILSGFRATADGGWAQGTVYSPRRGRSYPAELSLTADGRLDVKVKAGLMTTHQFWTR